MPTISQLPAAALITAADEVPLSQAGATVSVSVGTLLANTQPAIAAPSGTLLGRTSLGAGGPEPVSIGTGLLIASETLTATGADHAGFATQPTLVPNDQAVLNSSGTPKLLQLAVLRGLFTAGANISIDASGTISAECQTASSSASATYSITGLPSVSAIAATDLVGISQSSVDHTITYANFIDGQTIDEAEPAGTATDADTLWVAQGGSTMLRQTLAAIWGWIAAKLPTYQLPAVEITINTTLTATTHNGRIIVCSQPVTLSATPSSGFYCEIINLSGGNVTFATGIVTSSGTAILPTGQAARFNSATYSGGTVSYASMTGSGASVAVPGQVTGLAATTVTTNSVALSWSSTSPSSSSFSVLYRVTGTTSWSTASSTSVTGCVVADLLSGTSYDFQVAGVNTAGTGAPSPILTTATPSELTAPGQVSGLTVNSLTSSSASLNWSPPASGGAPGSYTIQYRVTGTTTWTTSAAGVTLATLVVTGLSAATSYDFQVFAINAAGAGSPSMVATASTGAGTGTVSSVTWNVVPSGSYTHGSGAIGINAHVSPATTPVQFGFSTSVSVPASTWVAASFVNTDLWGAYVPTPASAGTWYAWVEGMDGRMPTVYPTGFAVT